MNINSVFEFFSFYEGLIWAFEDGDYIQALSIFFESTFKIFVILGIIYFVLKYVIFWSFNASDSHGAAAWATEKEANKAKLLKNDNEIGHGIIAGKFAGKFVEVPGHTFICAPARSGKGVGPIVSTIFSYLGSMVINDPKGELYCITQKARREMGQNVILVDPFGVIEPLARREKLDITDCKTAKYNPLEFVDSKDPGCYSRAVALTDAFCAKDGGGGDDHFDRQAKNYIATVMLYLCECRDEKIEMEFPATMPGVRDFLSSGPDFMQHVATMRDTSKIKGVINGANGILGTGEKELGSILSSISGYIAFLDNSQLREFFSKNTVPVHSMYYTPTTIYFVSPSGDRIEGTKIARLLYADVLLFIQKIHKSCEELQKMEDNVLFMLDEFPQLLQFKLISEAIGLVQGIGATFCTVSQDVGQMRYYYKEMFTTFLGNSACLYLGAKDQETAKNVSEMLGKRTVVQRSADKKGGISQSETGKALMSTDEVLAAGPSKPIFFPGHMRPMRLKQLKYFEEKEFKEIASRNPYFNG